MDKNQDKKTSDPIKLKKSLQTFSYSSCVSKSQVFSVLLFVIQLSVNQIFVTPKVSKSENYILFVFFGFRYLLILFLVMDYIYLLKQDSIDPLIADPSQVYKYPPKTLIQCKQCHLVVKKSSIHCKSCKRCIDHQAYHSHWLNRCIGQRNFEYCIRFLFLLSFYLLSSAGIAIGVISLKMMTQILPQWQMWLIAGYIFCSGTSFFVVIWYIVWHFTIITELAKIVSQSKNKKKGTNPKFQDFDIDELPEHSAPRTAQYLKNKPENNAKKTPPIICVLPADYFKPQQAMSYYRK